MLQIYQYEKELISFKFLKETYQTSVYCKINYLYKILMKSNFLDTFETFSTDLKGKQIS